MIADKVVIWTPELPSGYGAFSCDQDEVEIQSSWCPLCKEGENHKDIKLCKECFQYLDEKIKL